MKAQGGNQWVFTNGDGSFVASDEVSSNCCPLAETIRLRNAAPGDTTAMKIRCRSEPQQRTSRNASKPDPATLTKRRRVEDRK